MSSVRRAGEPERRVVAFLLAAIGVSSLAVAAVLVLLGPPELSDSAKSVGLALQALGLMTVLGALAFSARWRARVTVSGVHARRLVSGSVVVAAVAESGFLAAVIGHVMRPGTALGAAAAIVYIATLLVLLAAAGSAELDGE